MKKLISYITICIIASILFSSCSSYLTVAKRHYNNGYYITYGKNKHITHTPIEEEKIVQTKTSEPLYSIKNTVEQTPTSGNADQSPITENNDVVASNEKTQHKAVSIHTIKQAIKQQTQIILYPAAQIKHTLFQTKQTNSNDSDREGLSLFWIVILIILILWALGYWGFGLVSGLINLLLLIALILLILWLLRII